MKSRTKNSLYSLLLLSAISLSTISCANDTDTKDAMPNAAPMPVSATTADMQSVEAMVDTSAHGEEAHKNHCYKCHTDDIYTRDNRFVKSIDALSQQVVRCKDGSNVPWFDEDADAVVQFLNKKYYKF